MGLLAEELVEKFMVQSGGKVEAGKRESYRFFEYSTGGNRFLRFEDLAQGWGKITPPFETPTFERNYGLLFSGPIAPEDLKK